MAGIAWVQGIQANDSTSATASQAIRRTHRFLALPRLKNRSPRQRPAILACPTAACDIGTPGRKASLPCPCRQRPDTLTLTVGALAWLMVSGMKVAVVLNETAGTLLGRPVAGVAADLGQAFAAHGVPASVVAARGPAVDAAIRAAVASDADAVVIGGGDGTVAAAAALLLGTGKALGLLPPGTMNLLARDLGMPADPRAAVEVLASGTRRLIDVGEVNGRVFLNNSVIGLFPALVRARERQRGVPGWRKWPAMASAVLKALRYYNLAEVEADFGHGPQPIRTPALAVVNNAYRDPGATFLHRPTLDSGRLAVYVARHLTRLGLVRLMAGLVLGGWQSDAELDSLLMTDLSVTSHTRRRLKVAIDGEYVRLAPPLVYRIRPRALPVLAPLP